jgi:dTDP-4-amino-4,6-dideoxygalactose transaminase
MISTQARDYPSARHIAECLYTLPTHTYMNEKDINNIVKAFSFLSEIRE